MFLTAALSCAILGDSIAVGIAQHRPECRRIAQAGITSQNWNRRHNIRIEADTIIISLGTNDSSGTERNIRSIRQRLHARRVIWVMPHNSVGNMANVRTAVINTASINGDRVINISAVARDGYHPTPNAYRQLARATR